MAVRLTDWQQSPPDLAAVRALLDACIAVDRVAPLSGHVVDGLGHGAEADQETASEPSVTTRFLAAYESDLLIGLAVVHGQDPAELAVSPASRGAGVGGSLLDRVLEQTPKVWAHGDLPAARALAAGRALIIVRVLRQMRRALSGDLPPIELPLLNGQRGGQNAVHLRTFVPGQDEDAFLAVNARAFSWHPEQGRLDRSGLAAEIAQDWFDPAGFFLAVDSADRVLGFHWTKVHAVDPTPGQLAPGVVTGGPIGEVYVLGVDPDSPVRGLGRPLSIAGLGYLRGRGLESVMLYVEGDNDRAVWLYDQLGFQRYLTDVVFSLPIQLPIQLPIA